MNSINKERDAARRHIFGKLGYQDRSRVWVSEVRSVGLEADLLSLPFVAGNTQQLQDPTTGALYSFYNIDPYGQPYAP